MQARIAHLQSDVILVLKILGEAEDIHVVLQRGIEIADVKNGDGAEGFHAREEDDDLLNGAEQIEVGGDEEEDADEDEEDDGDEAKRGAHGEVVGADASFYGVLQPGESRGEGDRLGDSRSGFGHEG